MIDLKYLQNIANTEFKDIIKHSFIKDYKLRIILTDGSFIDIHISKKLKGKFGFHWQCKNGRIYRYDNFPDKKAKNLKTYPYHFHNGKQENIEENPFSTDLEQGFREFLIFVRRIILL